MANTNSSKVELGFEAINFNLFNPITKSYDSLQNLKSDKATVIVFTCNHCPFVIHIIEKLVELSNEYIKKGISFIAISSNDIEEYPEDSPEKMIEYANKYRLNFPYLFDETQEIARKYDAQCTPEFYLFDNNMKLVYHGQFDDSRPGNNIKVTGNDLKNALDSLLYGNEIDKNQKNSVGCSIKWKK